MCACMSMSTRSLCTGEISCYHRYFTFEQNYKQISQQQCFVRLDILSIFLRCEKYETNYAQIR